MSGLRFLRFLKNNPFRSALLGLALFLVFDWVVIDLLQLRGRVVDSATGKAIADAWVLVDLEGEAPLFVVPLSPHPPSRSAHCMGSRAIKTSGTGSFYLLKLALNRQLANKRASVRVLKPGWIAARSSGAISSSVLGWPPSLRVKLDRVNGARRETKALPRAAQELPDHERTHSLELFQTLMLLSDAPCGPESSQFSSEVMNHAVRISETFDERDRTMAWCRHMRNKTPNASSVGSRPSNASNLALKHWPFDCENMPFKKTPSAETMAVEAEIAAQRRK